MNLGSKVFNSCMLGRLKAPVESVLRKHQAGFRSWRSCQDQVLVVRRQIEEAIVGVSEVTGDKLH